MTEKKQEEEALVPVTSSDFLTEYQSNKGASSRSYPKFDGTRFENPWDTWEKPGFMRMFSFVLSAPSRRRNHQIPPPEVLEANLPVKKINFKGKSPSQSLELTWIGHSTVLVRMDGISIITDPIFGEYCSHFKARRLRRYRPVPCSIDELPDDLRLVVISHNHADHLDYESILAIFRRFGSRVTFCVPKGLSAPFRSNLPGISQSGVVELNWWQCANFELKNQEKFKVVSVPAQHWSNPPINGNRSLWCGYVVIGPSGRKFYFAGDTGYCSAFKEIGAELGPIDLAAIPIGAYLPRDFLRFQHINPAEAAQIHSEIGSKHSVGIHWGTFRLGSEEILDPKKDLAQAASERNLPEKSFVTLCHGETLIV